MSDSLKGNVLCPYCDAIVCEDVRIQGQTVTCRACSALVRASKRFDRRRAEIGAVLFLFVLFVTANAVAFMPIDLAIFTMVASGVAWWLALQKIAPDRMAGVYGVPAKGGGSWFFFWWSSD